MGVPYLYVEGRRKRTTRLAFYVADTSDTDLSCSSRSSRNRRAGSHPVQGIGQGVTSVEAVDAVLRQRQEGFERLARGQHSARELNQAFPLVGNAGVNAGFQHGKLFAHKRWPQELFGDGREGHQVDAVDVLGVAPEPCPHLMRVDGRKHGEHWEKDKSGLGTRATYREGLAHSREERLKKGKVYLSTVTEEMGTQDSSLTLIEQSSP